MGLELIQTEIISLLAVTITTFVGFITKYAVSYLNKKGVVAQLENNKEVVKIVVNAIEQLYSELDGDEKLRLAKVKLVELANEKKINISSEELDLLIESSVKEMNDAINKELNK